MILSIPFDSVEMDMSAYSLHRVKAYFEVNIAVTDVGVRMFIQEFTVQGFKTIRDETIRRLGKMNIFVGKNDAGKSNILDAIRSFFEELQGIRGFETGLHDLIWPNVRREGKIVFKAKIKLDLEPVLSKFSRSIRASYGKKIGYKGKGSCTRIIIIERTLDAETKRWVTQRFNVGKLKVLNAKGTRINLTENDSTHKIEGIRYNSGTVDFVNAVFNYCKSQVTWIDLTRRSDLIESGFSGKREPSVPKDILDTILSWHSDDTSENRVAVLKLKALFHRFAGVKLRQNGSILRVEDADFEPPIASVGSGRQQIVTLSFNLLRAGKIVLLEEPETHFHPTLMRHAFRILRSFCENNEMQLFITTHSSVFLDHAMLFDIWLVENDIKKGTKCRPAIENKDYEAIADELGLMPSDACMSNAFLFVEGICDSKIILKCCRLMGFPLIRPTMSILEMKGKDKRYKIETWQPVIEAFPHVKLGLLVDADVKEDRFMDLQRALGNRNRAWKLDAGSIEDYYPIDLLKNALVETLELSDRQKKAINSLEPGTIAKKIDKILGKNESWKKKIADEISKALKKPDDIPPQLRSILEDIVKFLIPES